MPGERISNVFYHQKKKMFEVVGMSDQMVVSCIRASNVTLGTIRVCNDHE